MSHDAGSGSNYQASTARSRAGAIRPDDVAAAAALVKAGMVYDLDCGRWPGMPVWPGHPPFQVIGYRTPQGLRNEEEFEGTKEDGARNDVNFRYHTEVVSGTVHTGTHIDALCHVTCGVDDHWFGGGSSKTLLGDFGPLTDDAFSMPPIVARGVMIDIARAKQVKALPAGYEISVDELHDAMAAQGTEIRPGDVVILRTGYLSVWPDLTAMEAHSGAGIGVEAAQALVDYGAAVVGGDTEVVECIPSKVPGSPQPVHVMFLVEHGIHILELVNCEELARDEVYEFLFVCAALKIRGATGSMVRPLAVR